MPERWCYSRLLIFSFLFFGSAFSSSRAASILECTLTSCPSVSESVFATAQGVVNTTSTTFTLSDGQKLTGTAQWRGHDYLPFNDTGFVSITDPNSKTKNVVTGSVGQYGDYGYSPTVPFSVTAIATGTEKSPYTITAGVTNVGDGLLASEVFYSAKASPYFSQLVNKNALGVFPDFAGPGSIGAQISLGNPFQLSPAQVLKLGSFDHFNWLQTITGFSFKGEARNSIAPFGISLIGRSTGG
jgi:hypothetical protein